MNQHLNSRAEGLITDKKEAEERKVRLYWLILCTFVGWLVCLTILCGIGNFEPFQTKRFARAAILTGTVTFLIAAPFFTFLTRQWYIRRGEFRNSLSPKALLYYLERYWYLRARADGIEFKELDKHPVSGKVSISGDTAKSANDLFLKIYDEQYGFWAFLTPVFLLLLIVFFDAAIMAWLSECSSVSCNIFGEDPKLAVAAIAGAYMFAVGDSVSSVRQNKLNIADVYWYVLRLVIAIPLGLSAGYGGGPSGEAHTLLAFGLGALPVDALQKLIRRITVAQLNIGESGHESDQLISLEGVTPRTSAILTAEGITSIAQLQSKDPVLLAIRTGFEFDFVLYLAAQAIVRRHFGPAAVALIPLGLVEAQAIRQLVHMLKAGKHEPHASQILGDAVARLEAEVAKGDRVTGTLRRETIKTTFEQVAEAPYTNFLAHIARRGYRRLEDDDVE